MKRFFEFLRKERLYILLLVFIVLVHMIIVTASGTKTARQTAKVQATASTVVRQDDVEAKQPAILTTEARRAELEKVFSEKKQLAVLFALTSLLIIAVFLLGIAVDVLFLSAIMAKKKIDISTYRQGVVKWGVWDVAKVMILFLFFAYMVIIIESALLKVLPFLKDDNIRMILNTTVLDTLIVVFILYFAVGHYKEKIASLGLSLKNFMKNVLCGITAYVALVPVLVAILAAIAFISNMINYVPEKQAVVELFLKEKDARFLFYTSIFAAVVGPIIEELFFRGFMYSAFKKYVGVIGAMFITAVMFAALHAHAVGFIPIVALGLLLAYLYEKTGTLVSSITVHVIHNVAMVLLVFLVKQLGVG